MAIEREQYLNKLIQLKRNGHCKLIYSVRFCGKTHLLRRFINHLLAEDTKRSQILFYELGAWNYAHLTDEAALLVDIKSHLPSGKPCYVLLDDFHLIRQPEMVLQELAAKKEIDVYITTSNASFLCEESLQLFSGIDPIPLYPVSYREYREFCGDSGDTIWSDFVSYGGLPFILSKHTAEEKKNYLLSLIETCYIPDIVNRYHVRNESELHGVFCTLAAHTGSTAAYLQLAQNFVPAPEKQDGFDTKLTIDTTSSATFKKHEQYLEDALFIRKSKRYAIIRNRYFDSQARFYFVDHGICNACLQFDPENHDMLLYTIIYNELVLRGFSVDTGVLEYFTKDKNQMTIRNKCDVDFIARKGTDVTLIQLATSDADYAAKHNTLVRIRHACPKIILIKENVTTNTDDRGILTMGIQRYLLSYTNASETYI